jgi:hypothetical protein
MNTPEWLEAIKQRFLFENRFFTVSRLKPGPQHCDISALLQLVEKQREALKSINQIYTVGKDQSRFGYRNRDTVIPQIVNEALNFKPEGVEA